MSILRLFHSLFLIVLPPPPPSALRQPYRSRLFRVVLLTVFVIILATFIICQFAALLPLVTSQAWLRSDVLEPQPGVTAGESHMFLALGVLDRFPVVNSTSLHRLGYM